jgi:metacaspase-1
MAIKALLVGIDTYPNAPLSGSGQDVIDMANFLVDNSYFKPDEIDTLTDDRATTGAIKQRISRLISGAKSGDRIFFHYSGHGARYSDRDPTGNILSYHEVICPVDYDNSPERMITDDDFQELFAAIPPGAEFIWVSDSCCSGGLARDMLPRVSGGKSNRFFPIPQDIQWRVETARSTGLPILGFRGVALRLNGALMAACGPDETAWPVSDLGGYNGAFTYALLNQLKGPKGRTTPLTSLIPMVQQELDNLALPQHPELHGNPAIMGKPFLKV